MVNSTSPYLPVQAHLFDQLADFDKKSVVAFCDRQAGATTWLFYIVANKLREAKENDKPIEVIFATISRRHAKLSRKKFVEFIQQEMGPFIIATDDDGTNVSCHVAYNHVTTRAILNWVYVTKNNVRGYSGQLWVIDHLDYFSKDQLKIIARTLTLQNAEIYATATISNPKCHEFLSERAPQVIESEQQTWIKVKKLFVTRPNGETMMSELPRDSNLKLGEIVQVKVNHEEEIGYGVVTEKIYKTGVTHATHVDKLGDFLLQLSKH